MKRGKKTMTKVEKMNLADKSNYVLTKIVKMAQYKNTKITYISVNHTNFSFLVVCRIAGIIVYYYYNGTDKVVITCNGKAIGEYIE